MPATVKQFEIDHGWKNIKKQFMNKKDINLEVGLFGNGSDPKNNPAYLGLIHQKGAEIKITDRMRKFLMTIGIFVKKDTLFIIIPKRPFMSEPFDTHLQSLINYITSQYKLVLDGVINFKQMIDRTGVFHEAQLKKGFTEFNWAPNHPATVAGKGSSQPLITNGQMRNSIKYKVVTR